MIGTAKLWLLNAANTIGHGLGCSALGRLTAFVMWASLPHSTSLLLGGVGHMRDQDARACLRRTDSSATKLWPPVALRTEAACWVHPQWMALLSALEFAA